MMPMDPKKLINLFSWKHSPIAVFSYLNFADIIVGFLTYGYGEQRSYPDYQKS